MFFFIISTAKLAVFEKGTTNGIILFRVVLINSIDFLFKPYGACVCVPMKKVMH